VSAERITVAEVRARLADATGHERDALLSKLERDPRAGVRAIVDAARARDRRLKAEDLRLEGLMTLQRDLHRRGFSVIAGVDEVGRGALAGPVTAAAVILASDARIEGLNDSKKLTREARERIAAAVLEQAVASAVAHAQPAEIDAMGIGRATRLAWRRALEGLGMPYDHVIVDGNDGRDLGLEVTMVVRGDSRVACVAAASVIAKVARDALMAQLSPAYPGYGFDGNRGYGSPDHLEHLRLVGPCDIHRRSFTPCLGCDRLF
jgi:ribonuclease HII